MKRSEVFITTSLGALAILLTIALITISQANGSINKALLEQQNVINQGRVGQQVGQAVLRDMAAVSLQNEKMKEVLAKNGFNVSRQQEEQ